MNPTATDVVTTPPREVERFFVDQVGRFKRALVDVESQLGPDVVPEREDRYHRRVLAAFQESQDACRHFEQTCADPALLADTQARFRRETDFWFRQSWIAGRARTKPSGFAGDYEMLRKLYAEATPARGLGAYLDFCILDLPLARAVRARMAAVRDFLIREASSREADIRILDIACGPCEEYESWPNSHPDRRIDVVAMDSDPKALAYVNEVVAPRLGTAIDLQAVRYNALRTRSASATTRKFGNFDIVYSVGLCDYLPDDHLVAMLAAWRDTLTPGGALYVAFKDTERYDKTPYQWHLDWFFYQRTFEDVLGLYDSAGFDVEGIEITRDETGIIINLVHRQAAHQRIDPAQGVAEPHSGRESPVSTRNSA